MESAEVPGDVEVLPTERMSFNRAEVISLEDMPASLAMVLITS
jgi:hypothetical protein